MATSRSKKSDQLSALEEKFKAAAGIAFAQFNKATVEEVQQIRRDLRKNGMSYTVIKKTLIALAAKNTGKAEFSPNDLEGAVSVIVSTEDEIAPAAAIKKMKKDTFDKALKISKYDFAGAVFEGKFINKAEATTLADTPTREESLAKILSMLRSGPQKLHGVLGSGLRGIHGVLKDAEKFAPA